MSLVADAMPRVAPLLRDFSIRPSFRLEAKIVEIRPEEAFIGLILDIDTKWEISRAQMMRQG